MGSSKNNLQWDESRSPQWRYLLGQKDRKYNSRKRDKDHLFNEAGQQKQDKYTQTSQKDMEIAEMTDCSSKNDLINAELTTQLNKIDKSRVRRVKNNDIRRITRISVKAKTD
jgi:hypothetical protein